MKANDKNDKGKAAAKKPNGRVFDVRRPGKAPASPSSRPVILGHKPEAQEAQTAVSGIGEAQPLLTRRKIQIVPGGDAAASASDPAPAPEKPAAEPVAKPATEPTADKPVLTTKISLNQASDQEKEALAAVALGPVGPPAADPDARPRLAARPERKIEPLQSAEKTETEAPAPEAAPQDKDAEPTAEERPLLATTSVPEEAPSETAASASSEPTAAKAGDNPLLLETTPESTIEPLFDDSGVIVSTHNHHHHHGLKVMGLLLLILILAAVAFDVLLDLGLLTLEGIPHTDLLTQ